MGWPVPVGFLGEFDAQEGPKINYAFEYFAHDRDMAASVAPPNVYLVSGAGFAGRHVATGKLFSEYHDFMRGVAARVLTSNEAHEESALFHESGSPAVGSLTFCLSDILARGEKRRFCLVFMHDDHNVLVSRWPLITALMCVAIRNWTRMAMDRYQLEYRAFPDIERRRDEARKKPLRRVTTLLSDRAANVAAHEGEFGDGDASEGIRYGALRRMHCFFEAAMPIIFATNAHIATNFGDHVAPDRSLSVSSSHHRENDQRSFGAADPSLCARLETAAIIAESAAIPLDFDDTASLLRVPAFRGSDIVVRPLVIWLRGMAVVAGADPSQPWRAMETLLYALFTGNQILIVPCTAASASDAANLALALAYELPPPLARLALLAEDHVMPYTARIVSFGGRFLDAPFALSQLDAGGAVCVTLGADGAIASVVECGLPRKGPLAVPGHRGRPATPPLTPSASTLTDRIVALVRQYVRDEPQWSPPPLQAGRTACSVTALRLLDAQVKELVREYVMRGRVYASLYRAQEVAANRDLLGLPGPSTAGGAGADASPAAPPPPGRAGSRGGVVEALSSLWSRTTRPAAAPVGRPRRRADHVGAPANQCGVRRSASLAVDAGRIFSQDSFIFASSAPEDHAVLTFLGSAA